MSMKILLTFAIGVLLRPHCASVLGAHLGAPTFVVGPKPQPLLPDSKDILPRSNPLSSSIASIIPKDALFPNFELYVEQGGGRRLNQPLVGYRYKEPFSNHSDRTWHKTSASKSRRRLENTCSVRNTILSFTLADNTEVGSPVAPACPSGAVGMQHLVAVGHSKIEVRHKNGTLVFRDTIKGFFSGLAEAVEYYAIMYYPKVVYDEHEGRFVVVVLQAGYTNTSLPISRIFFAVSKGETPASVGDWNQVAINASLVIDGEDAYPNYPGLAVDSEVIYVTASMYLQGSLSTVGVRLWVVDKGVSGGFYGGGNISFKRYDPFQSGGVVASMVPAQVHGVVGSSIGSFFVSYLGVSEGTSKAQVVTVFNPLGTQPTFTIQTINLGIFRKHDEDRHIFTADVCLSNVDRDSASGTVQSSQKAKNRLAHTGRSKQYRFFIERFNNT
jgi:hypothetical protein